MVHLQVGSRAMTPRPRLALRARHQEQLYCKPVGWMIPPLSPWLKDLRVALTLRPIRWIQPQVMNIFVEPRLKYGVIVKEHLVSR